MTDNLCNNCPRQCNTDRLTNKGFCNAGVLPQIARAELHKWEEPPISGVNGSGTIFFTGCNLKCVYCQNYLISCKADIGKKTDYKTLSEVMLNLQTQGAHNINLLTPTPHINTIISSVKYARDNGLTIPIIYNTNSYECILTIKRLEGLIDIYIPDFKYAFDALGERYSKADNYTDTALKSIQEMFKQVGTLVLENDIAKKGLIVRHLVLPCNLANTRAVLDIISNVFPKEIHISLMRQYTPVYQADLYNEINREITAQEYRRAVDYALSLGFRNIFTQNADSAGCEYIPDWNLI